MILRPILVLAITLLGCGGSSGDDASDSIAPRGFMIAAEGVLRSDDAGVTWTAVRNDPTLTAVEFVSRDEGWVAGATSVLHTTDGGDSWTDQFANVSAGVGGIGDIAFRNDALEGILVGSRPRPPVTFSGPALVLRTTNGGANWDRAPVDAHGDVEVGRNALSSVCLTATSIALACGVITHRICLLSEDGGASWLNISERVRGIAVACVGARDLWVLDQGSRIFRSGDGGTTWVERSTALPVGFSGNLRALTFVDALHGWLVGDDAAPGPNGAQSPIVLHTDDGGNSWRQQRLPAGHRITLRFIDFVSRLQGVASGSFRDDFGTSTGSAFWTADGGETWTEASLPLGTRGAGAVTLVR